MGERYLTRYLTLIKIYKNQNLIECITIEGKKRYFSFNPLKII